MTSNDNSNVIPLFGVQMHDLPVDELLDKAKSWDMKRCIVLGEDESGEVCIGGSILDLPTITWLAMRLVWWCQRSENEEI